MLCDKDVSMSRKTVMNASVMQPSNQIVSIQYLRAAAALMVVYNHVFSNHLVSQYDLFKTLGEWGVDIFFVISGFIMWSSTRKTRQSPAAFAAKRFYRISPLYWVLLTV